MSLIQMNEKDDCTLGKLRNLYKTLKIDCYLVPLTDPHDSEYVLESDQRVKFISGFSGSSAFIIIGTDTVSFFTDGRYTIQAKQELPSDWELKEKLSKVRDELALSDNQIVLIYKLDSIAWILNARADDIMYNRVIYSYLLLDKTTVHWFVLNSSQRLKDQDMEIFLLNSANQGLIDFMSKCNIKINFSEDIIQNIKSVKTDKEIELSLLYHARDSLAISTTLCYVTKWYESVSANQIGSDTNFSLELLDEEDVCKLLADQRLNKLGADGLSFETISGFNENSAIVHYRINEKTAKKFANDGVLLVDSGAHYSGVVTTDCTRTIYLGTPPDEVIRHYTYTLAAHINLANIVFPNNKLSGSQLDTVCRAELWKQGLDFNHSTGHGVGSGTVVHESPPGICYLSQCKAKPTYFVNHMVVSNEPGLYFPEKYGIRLENVQYSALQKNQIENEDQVHYLCFKQLTMVPYCRKLIDPSLLTKEQLDWLNSYHKEVYEKLAKLCVHLPDYSLSYSNKCDLQLSIGNFLGWLRSETKPFVG
ncbi:xaa-Pro aminopeptidase 1-like [Dermatophagoides farinae]|uniref:xaa-Pro aminopeptidase 1-like n=1 Tax=Dermatophagoides farinae TaxID=6954 RepID=UPI003F5F2303